MALEFIGRIPCGAYLLRQIKHWQKAAGKPAIVPPAQFAILAFCRHLRPKPCCNAA